MKLLKFFAPCIIGILILLIGWYLFILWIPLPKPSEYTPTDGVWYCETLQITLSFTAEKKSFITIDGEEILCECGNDIGSPDIYLLCQEPANRRYSLGELIFWGVYVSLDKDVYILEDHYTGELYRFLRVE